jgi:histidinol-phosphate/aromatic aminotransferase/cobyric acid decarboxylase-like protein
MRDCSDKQGLDGKQYMRIAVRSHDDNAKLIAAFRQLQQ